MKGKQGWPQQCSGFPAFPRFPGFASRNPTLHCFGKSRSCRNWHPFQRYQDQATVSHFLRWNSKGSTADFYVAAGAYFELGATIESKMVKVSLCHPSRFHLDGGQSKGQFGNGMSSHGNLELIAGPGFWNFKSEEKWSVLKLIKLKKQRRFISLRWISNGPQSTKLLCYEGCWRLPFLALPIGGNSFRSQFVKIVAFWSFCLVLHIVLQN